MGNKEVFKPIQSTHFNEIGKRSMGSVKTAVKKVLAELSPMILDYLDKQAQLTRQYVKKK